LVIGHIPSNLSSKLSTRRTNTTVVTTTHAPTRPNALAATTGIAEKKRHARKDMPYQAKHF
jgi:hypothetical protein